MDLAEGVTGIVCCGIIAGISVDIVQDMVFELVWERQKGNCHCLILFAPSVTLSTCNNNVCGVLISCSGTAGTMVYATTGIQNTSASDALDYKRNHMAPTGPTRPI